VLLPVLLVPGVIAPSCAALTPGRVNASAATPARGSCDTLTPVPVEGLLADRPAAHAVEEVVGADGDPKGVERIELGAGDGCTG